MLKPVFLFLVCAKTDLKKGTTDSEFLPTTNEPELTDLRQNLKSTSPGLTTTSIGLIAATACVALLIIGTLGFLIKTNNTLK